MQGEFVPAGAPGKSPDSLLGPTYVNLGPTQAPCPPRHEAQELPETGRAWRSCRYPARLRPAALPQGQRGVGAQNTLAEILEGPESSGKAVFHTFFFRKRLCLKQFPVHSKLEQFPRKLQSSSAITIAAIWSRSFTLGEPALTDRDHPEPAVHTGLTPGPHLLQAWTHVRWHVSMTIGPPR